jgi:hypothetical protein
LAVGVVCYFQLKEEEELLARVRKTKERLQHDQSPSAKKAFTDASRTYYAKLRKNGKPSIYDEQRIANDLQESLPHAGPSIGAYNDQRTIVNVRKAVLSPSDDSPAQIQRGIMLTISSNPTGEATMPDLMSAIAADQEKIEAVLGKLMVKGLIIIANRADGVICYRIDNLL